MMKSPLRVILAIAAITLTICQQCYAFVVQPKLQSLTNKRHYVSLRHSTNSKLTTATNASANNEIFRSTSTTSAHQQNNKSVQKSAKHGTFNTFATASAKATALILPLFSPSVVHSIEESMDDIEIAELPPVWVPIVFAIVILGGVGLLTSSLGDVYSEGWSCYTRVVLFTTLNSVRFLCLFLEIE